MSKRLTFAALASLAMATVALLPVSANAAPFDSVGAGTEIAIQINAEERASCTVAGSGKDSFGNKVALTAGHCGDVGNPVYNTSGKRIGTVATSVQQVDEALQFNKLDYAFIRLRKDIRLMGPSELRPRGIAAKKPTFGQVACKDGITTGITCGMLLASSRTEGISFQFTYFGDSGGPVVQNGKLIGVTSRATYMEVITPTVYTFAKDIVADATANGSVGAGFVQVG